MAAVATMPSAQEGDMWRRRGKRPPPPIATRSSEVVASTSRPPPLSGGGWSANALDSPQVGESARPRERKLKSSLASATRHRRTRSGSLTSPTVGEEEVQSPMTSKGKMRPWTRRPSREPSSLDLSRSVLDDEPWGLYHPETEGALRAMTETSNPTGRGHHRSISGTSQLSSGTGTTTPAAPARPYAHPMRQTPRPYTPPLAQSYATTSYFEPPEGSDTAHRPTTVRPQKSSTSLNMLETTSDSLPASTTAPLRLQTDLSSSRFFRGSTGTPPSSTRTSSPTPPLLRLRSAGLNATTSSIESPLDRSSSRAARIDAARQAFSEKEAKKAARAEKIAASNSRAQQRADRKRGTRSTPPAGDPAPSAPPGHHPLVVAGREYSTLRPGQAPTPGDVPRPGTDHEKSPAKGGASQAWLRFVVWLKTRLLRLGRRLKRQSNKG